MPETCLDAGACGGEEASISVRQPGNTPASRFLGADTSVRTGGQGAHQTVPLDRPAHGEAGDKRSCQPPAAGVSGHGGGERFWRCAGKVCKTYSYLWGCVDAGAKSMSLTLGARKLNSSDGWVKSVSV